MRHRKRTAGLHSERQTERARGYYRELRGEESEARRAAGIAALPSILWRGETLHTLRCHGDFGKGPHDQHVPEALLWALMSLARYRCAYHRN